MITRRVKEGFCRRNKQRQFLYLFQNSNPVEQFSQSLLFIRNLGQDFLVTNSAIGVLPRNSDSNRSRVDFHQAIQMILIKLCSSSETLKVNSQHINCCLITAEMKWWIGFELLVVESTSHDMVQDRLKVKLGSGSRLGINLEEALVLSIHLEFWIFCQEIFRQFPSEKGFLVSLFIF